MNIETAPFPGEYRKLNIQIPVFAFTSETTLGETIKAKAKEHIEYLEQKKNHFGDKELDARTYNIQCADIQVAQMDFMNEVRKALCAFLNQQPL